MTRSIRPTAVNFLAVLTAACLIVGVSALSVYADTISVNFNGGNGNTTTFNGPSVTGTAGVNPVGNWNNEPGDSGTGVAVVNSLGGAAGTLSYNAGNVWGATPSGGGTSGGAGDNALMTGYLDNFASGTGISVSGLGFQFTRYGYSVLVYQNGDSNGSFGYKGVDSNSNTDTRYGLQTGGNGGNYPLVSGTNGFIGSTSTSSAGPGSAADYVILTGFNGSSFTLTGINGTTGDGRSRIDGFQIISNTPEPSTFILGGLGLIGLLVAARRRRA